MWLGQVQHTPQQEESIGEQIKNELLNNIENPELKNELENSLENTNDLLTLKTTIKQIWAEDLVKIINKTNIKSISELDSFLQLIYKEKNDSLEIWYSRWVEQQKKNKMSENIDDIIDTLVPNNVSEESINKLQDFLEQNIVNARTVNTDKKELIIKWLKNYLISIWVNTDEEINNWIIKMKNRNDIFTDIN